MAKKDNLAEVIPVIEEAPQAMSAEKQILCCDCKFWRRRQAAPGSKANIGECDFSRTFMPSPLMTLDLSTCSQAREA